ncbi:hypothetical protein [Mycoplasma buteonis]|uniref:hypothetical protein n=1 Tax=Mycoplasma buteonis TaxID=171280 RepID=UPI0005615A2B|nr:hypothetical protein [Mycoplasma buteonis]
MEENKRKRKNIIAGTILGLGIASAIIIPSMLSQGCKMKNELTTIQNQLQKILKELQDTNLLLKQRQHELEEKKNNLMVLVGNDSINENEIDAKKGSVLFELREDIARGEEEISLLKKKIAKLTSEKEVLQNQLADEIIKNEALTKKVDELQSNLTKEIAQKEALMHQLTKEREETRKEKTRLQAQIDENNMTIRLLDVNIQRLEKENADKDEEIAKLKTEKTQLQQENEEQALKISSLQDLLLENYKYQISTLAKVKDGVDFSKMMFDKIANAEYSFFMSLEDETSLKQRAKELSDKLAKSIDAIDKEVEASMHKKLDAETNGSYNMLNPILVNDFIETSKTAIENLTALQKEIIDKYATKLSEVLKEKTQLETEYQDKSKLSLDSVKTTLDALLDVASTNEELSEEKTQLENLKNKFVNKEAPRTIEQAKELFIGANEIASTITQLLPKIQEKVIDANKTKNAENYDALISSVKEKFAVQKAKISEIIETFKDNSEFNDLKTKMQEYANAIVEDADLTTVESKVAKIKEYIAKTTEIATGSLELMKEFANKQKTKIDEKGTELTDVKRKLSNSNSGNADAERQIQELTNKISSLTMQLGTKDTLIREKNDEIERLKKELAKSSSTPSVDTSNSSYKFKLAIPIEYDEKDYFIKNAEKTIQDEFVFINSKFTIKINDVKNQIPAGKEVDIKATVDWHGMTRDIKIAHMTSDKIIYYSSSFNNYSIDNMSVSNPTNKNNDKNGILLSLFDGYYGSHVVPTGSAGPSGYPTTTSERNGYFTKYTYQNVLMFPTSFSIGIPITVPVGNQESMKNIDLDMSSRFDFKIPDRENDRQYSKQYTYFFNDDDRVNVKYFVPRIVNAWFEEI